MYRCQLCKSKCEGSMKKHVEKRADGSIAREVPVCYSCQMNLKGGVPIECLVVTDEMLPSEAVVVEVDVPRPPSPQIDAVVEVGVPVNLTSLPFEVKRRRKSKAK